jgi:hypothetical protein
MEGYNAQIDCIECQLDGSGQLGDGWSNIFLGNLAGGNFTPTSIHFVNLTSQSANIAVQLDGAAHITFLGPHFEALNGAFLLQRDGTGSTDVATTGVLISNPLFAGNVGENNGNGYIINAISATAITLQAPIIQGKPDFVIAGASSQNVKVY